MTSGARNPWLWATIVVAVLAIALGIWGLHERSNADDAKADQQAQAKQSAPPPRRDSAQTTTQETQPAPQTQTAIDDDRA